MSQCAFANNSRAGNNVQVNAHVPRRHRMHGTMRTITFEGMADMTPNAYIRVMRQAMAAEARTGETTPFGRMLKDWRKLRRVSQLDLAMTAGTTQRHLSFLESGRARPSREMVLRLGDALDAPLREQNGLLMAAGYAPVFRERQLTDPELSEVYDGLKIMLHQFEPYPAIAVDRCWNLVLTNDVAMRVFAEFVQIDEIWHRISPDQRHNILRLMFHPEGLRPFMRNWETVARTTLNRAHREVAGSIDSDELAAILGEISSYEGFPTRWQVPDWEASAPPVLPMELEKDGVKLCFYNLIATFGTPQDVTLQELYVETFMPADRATQEYVGKLADKAPVAAA